MVTKTAFGYWLLAFSAQLFGPKRRQRNPKNQERSRRRPQSRPILPFWVGGALDLRFLFLFSLLSLFPRLEVESCWSCSISSFGYKGWERATEDSGLVIATGGGELRIFPESKN